MTDKRCACKCGCSLMLWLTPFMDPESDLCVFCRDDIHPMTERDPLEWLSPRGVDSWRALWSSLPDDERVNRRELLALCDAADELREAREKIAELRSCRTCGGEPGAQNCVCGGTNNVDREITGLRLVLLERDKEVTSLSAEVERLKGEVEKYTDEAPRLVDTIAALSRKYDAANDLASSLSARLASLREQGIAEVDEFDPLGPSLRICGVYVRSSYHQTRREQLVDLHEAADAVNSAFRVRLEGRG